MIKTFSYVTNISQSEVKSSLKYFVDFGFLHFREDFRKKMHHIDLFLFMIHFYQYKKSFEVLKLNTQQKFQSIIELM